MKRMFGFLGVPLGLVFSIIGAITYIINVVDTWRSGGSALINILINLTLDAFLAAIWPVTWILWIFHHYVGKSSPLDWLFK